MAVPKKRSSKARRDTRRAQNSKLDPVTLVTCSSCGELMQPHNVCKKCGSYDKKQIISIKTKKK